jgi:hypothetical protein
MVKFATVLLSLAILVFCSSSNATAVDPGADWEILETAHFQIVFDSKHYPLALRYAYAAEQAFAATQPFFSYHPKKTVVVINDTTDLANGAATGLPYPMIIAFPVLPTPLESIDDYGNWESELMTHEYAHILQFEPATGLAKPLRSLFGTIVRPNMLLPRWYLEGQAVFLESRLSNFGRMRSQTAMAVPRALAEEGVLTNEDISRLNELSIPDGVDGLRPYILGSLVWSEVALRGGEDAIRLLNEDHSRRMPFFINAPPKRRLGMDYAQLLNEAYTRVMARATVQLEQINKAGKYNSVPLPEQDGLQYRSPLISPDGKQLVFVSQAHNTDERVEWIERAEVTGSFSQMKRKVLFGGISINRASWLPDSSGLIFDKIDSIEYYYSFSDLYRYDFASKKVTRLTKKLRAREPVVSRDGTKITFVQVVPGGTRLAQVDITGQNPVVIYEPAQPNLRLSSPEYFSDKEIIFAEKPLNGAEQLKVVNLETRQVKTVVCFRSERS